MCAHQVSLGVMLPAPLSHPGDFSLFSFVHTQAQNVLVGELFAGMCNGNPKFTNETISMTQRSKNVVSFNLREN